jgi:hypothetical protein
VRAVALSSDEDVATEVSSPVSGGFKVAVSLVRCRCIHSMCNYPPISGIPPAIKLVVADQPMSYDCIAARSRPITDKHLKVHNTRCSFGVPPGAP